MKSCATSGLKAKRQVMTSALKQPFLIGSPTTVRFGKKEKDSHKRTQRSQRKIAKYAKKHERKFYFFSDV